MYRNRPVVSTLDRADILAIVAPIWHSDPHFPPGRWYHDGKRFIVSAFDVNPDCQEAGHRSRAP